MLSRSIRRFSTSTPLLKNKVHLTLFGKEGCSLCDQAKTVLSQVLESKSSINKKFELKYVDITDPLNKLWWEKYCFDVPVLHFDRFEQPRPVKMMHRLETNAVIKEIEK